MIMINNKFAIFQTEMIQWLSRWWVCRNCVCMLTSASWRLSARHGLISRTVNHDCSSLLLTRSSPLFNIISPLISVEPPALTSESWCSVRLWVADIPATDTETMLRATLMETLTTSDCLTASIVSTMTSLATRGAVSGNQVNIIDILLCGDARSTLLCW